MFDNKFMNSGLGGSQTADTLSNIRNTPQPDFSSMSLRDELKTRMQMAGLWKEGNLVKGADGLYHYEEKTVPYTPRLAADMTDSAVRSDAPTLPATAATETTPDDESDYLQFDGKKLSWYQKGQLLRSWDAVSGQLDHQCRDYMSLKNKGPMPEGEWLVSQKRYQNYDRDASFIDKYVCPAYQQVFKEPCGAWNGGTESWGNNRIELQPTPSVNTFGRSGIWMHGGTTPGSAGCLDLGDNMDDFTQYFLQYGKDLPLRVRYPDGCWNIDTPQSAAETSATATFKK